MRFTYWVYDVAQCCDTVSKGLLRPIWLSIERWEGALFDTMHTGMACRKPAPRLQAATVCGGADVRVTPVNTGGCMARAGAHINAKHWSARAFL